MDDDSPVAHAGTALTHKFGPLPLWAWGAIGGVALFLLMGRKGSGTSQAATISAEQQQAQAHVSQEQAARQKQQGALDEMNLSQARRDFDLAGLVGEVQKYALQRELQGQKALLAKEGKAKFQCPPGQGSLKRDPATGALYCRAKARKGNSLTDLFGYAERAASLYAKVQTGGVSG